VSCGGGGAWDRQRWYSSPRSLSATGGLVWRRLGSISRSVGPISGRGHVGRTHLSHLGNGRTLCCHYPATKIRVSNDAIVSASPHPPVYTIITVTIGNSSSSSSSRVAAAVLIVYRFRQLTKRRTDTSAVAGLAATSLNIHYARVSTDDDYHSPSRKQTVAPVL